MNRIEQDSNRLAAQDADFSPDRRGFLGGVAALSAGLLFGSPPMAEAKFKSSLQVQVLDLLKQLRRQGQIGDNERYSWGVYDFTSGRTLVSINADSQRQAASMIKPFVAQAYFFQVKKSGGRVRYTGEVRGTMERMIRRSSNTATNQLMDMVSRNQSGRGPKDVEAVLKTNAPTIFQQTRIVETIPAGGKTYRNLASAEDYNRFLIALWNDKLPYSEELRAIMALPKRDRIVHGVEAIPDSVRVYEKTGSTARLCGDMGIIEAPGRNGRRYPYTFVGIIERPTSAKNYGAWITKRANAIRAVSGLVYLDMKERYRLV
jgi:beta-lactamase class A